MGSKKHGLQIIDSDAHFTVDPITRNITNDESTKNTILQGDHNSERFTFKIPRYIDGHDMSTCDNVRVAYINTETSGRDKKHGTGVYLVGDLAVDTTGNYVTCSWLISKNATTYTGILNFMLIFSCMDGELVKYRWKTNVFESIFVALSLDADLIFEAEYLDVIEQWKDAVKNEFSVYLEDSAKHHYNEFKTVLHEEMATEFDAMQEDLDERFKTKSDSLDEQIDGFDEILRTEITNMDGEIDTLKSRMNTFSSLKEGSTTGDAELADIRVGADGETYDSAGEAVRGQVERLHFNVANLGMACRTNLFDLDSITEGGYIGSDGAQVSSNHFETDFIECLPGDIIRIIRNGEFYTPNGNIIACYDRNKNFIKTKNTKAPVIITDIPNLMYIRIPLDNFCLKGTIMITRNDETLYTDFVPYVKNVGELLTASEALRDRVSGAEERLSILENVKYFNNCLQLGDSITWYDGRVLNGTSDVAYGYASYLRELGIAVTNAGVNGACVAYHEESHYEDISTTVDRYTENMTDYDLITIAGGVNDYQSFPSPMGDFSASDFDLTTFVGAYQYIIETILNNNPTTQIVLFTPLKCYNFTKANSYGFTLGYYANKVKEIGEYYSIPVLDLYSIGGINQLNASIVTLDKLHPNNEGYKLVGGKLLGFVKNLK